MDRRWFLRNAVMGAAAAGVGLRASPYGYGAVAGGAAGSLVEKDFVPGWEGGRRPMAGPLRVLASNPRYFTDDSGRAIFLTGSHTWANFQDSGLAPVPQFDYAGYIDMMVRNNQNFMRLWHWEQAANAPWTAEKILFEPLPYLRTGPGVALDGGPKFDLTKFNPAYFDRMRSRIAYAGEHGIYASVQLFQSFSAQKKPADMYCGRPWEAHPYNPANNINGFSGEEGSSGTISLHRLAVRAMQAAYLTRVIETVHDLNNVLYEVMNEGGDREWDWWVVDFVHAAEARMGHVHPVGLTGYDSEPLRSMLESRCDWVSPSVSDSKLYKTDPPAWDGKKVAVLDTDHLWGTGGNPIWPWKSFCRGYNTLLMDPWTVEAGKPCKAPHPTPGDPAYDVNDRALWPPIRRAMGNTRSYALRMNLAAMTPQNELASSGYCLANPGVEYLAYFPEGYEGTVDLTGFRRQFQVEWMHPVAGTRVGEGTTMGGHPVEFTVPFGGPAVLYLRG